jgi:alpha-D-xyloside xylohydrolase
MSPTHELKPFLGEVVPVDLVARLVDLRVEGGSVTMRCGTDRYTPLLQDYYGTVAETVFTPPSTGDDATVRVDFWTPGILRCRFAPGDSVPDSPLPGVPGFEGSLSPMVTGEPDERVDLQVEEHEDRVVVRSSVIELTVLRDPWRLEARERDDGRLIWATKPVDIDGLRRPRNQWSPIEQRWIFLHRYAYPLGVTRGSSRRAAFASFDLRHDERVVGFGESFARVNKVGTSQEMWLQEAFGNASPAVYKQVPWYISDRHHGVLVHTSNAMRFDVGSKEHSALSMTVDDTDALDWFVVAGRPAELLSGYTRLTGRAALPPRWSFGFWLGRITFRHQDEVEAVVAEMRRRRIPCDVIHIDTGWFAMDYVCDLTFSPERFPDPAALMQRLAALGIRVSLWQWPNYNVTSPLFDEGARGGHLAKRTSGHTFVFAGGYGDDAGLIDFSSPAAVAWFQQKLALLFDLGAAAIKVDYGEGAPPSAVYANVPSEAMHNLYPLLYQHAVWQAASAAAAQSQDAPVIWARAGWTGSQRYPVHWSGDGVARFEDLACVLRAGLSIGLSGFPFYSHDVGGFSGNPSPELWVRWLQLGAFSSHVRAHGSPPREPWEYGEVAEALTRRYLELRYRLLPYLWTESVSAVETSLPVVRAMLLEYPDDPVAWNVDDQYLFGSSLLVAPVLEEGATRRSVWLPEGEWFDFWTGKKLEGPGHVTVEAPLETLPLLVRGGSLLPMGPASQYVDEVPCDPLTLHLYAPRGVGEQQVHLAGGVTVLVRWRRLTDGRVEVTCSPAPGVVECVVHGLSPEPRSKSGNGQGGVVLEV